MVFDVLSFLAGVTAGAATGVLAVVLHGLENTADLQERLRNISREMERMRGAMASRTPEANGKASSARMDELSRDLNEIHEEIRRMYKKGKN